MNRDKFISYLDRPETLDVDNLYEIRGVLDEYPYFQTAHMLLVKILNNLQDMRFNNQLKFSAAHVGNRNILFNLINQHQFILNAEDGPPGTAGTQVNLREPVSVEEGPVAGASVEKDQEDTDRGEIKPEVEEPGETGAEESLADRILREVEEMKRSGGKVGDTGNTPVAMPEPEDQAGDVLQIDDKADIANQEEHDPTVIGQDDIPAGNPDTELLELDKSDPGVQTGQEQQEDLTAAKPEKKNLTPPENLRSEAHSFTSWLDLFEASPHPEDQSFENEAEDRNRGHELIDRFLKEKPRIEPRSPLDDDNPPADMAERSTRENEEFFTETLARIYVQQKHYKKAIYAYEKLCLKYPEKYSYFADQIDQIKRFINQ